MTEITFHKKSFLATIEAFKTQFNVVDTTLQLETEANGERFSLLAKRSTGQNVQAFGPCEVKGEPVSIQCDMLDLEQAIVSAHERLNEEKITLLVGDGLWVKDPATDVSEAD